jgi:hypothetical protein
MVFALAPLALASSMGRSPAHGSGDGNARSSKSALRP